MKFNDYFYILKSNFVNKITNEELFGILMDSVIGPLNLSDRNGEILYFEKSVVSLILSDKRPMPAKLQENVFKPAVTRSIVSYFEENIVSELTPNKEDICYQIMQLVHNDTSISPATKASMEMLATPGTIAALLAQVFPYAVRASSKELPSDTCTVSESPFSICGIQKDGTATPNFSIELFSGNGGHSSTDKRAKLLQLYDEINNLHLNNELSKASTTSLIRIYRPTPASIHSNIQETITHCAEAIGIELSDDFFNLGDLVENQFKPQILVGGSSVEGSKQAKRKYSLIHKLHKHIYDCIKWFPIEDYFCDKEVILLAITNNGTSPDQDVSVILEFDKNAIMQPVDFLDCKLDTLATLVSDYDPYEFFEIPRSVNYLDYNSTVNDAVTPSFSFQVKHPFKSHSEVTREEILFELEDIFRYYYGEKDGKSLIEIKFDEVMHNTSVAFPTALFIKEKINTIRYTIKTRNLPSPITGELHLVN